MRAARRKGPFGRAPEQRPLGQLRTEACGAVHAGVGVLITSPLRAREREKVGGVTTPPAYNQLFVHIDFWDMNFLSRLTPTWGLISHRFPARAVRLQAALAATLALAAPLTHAQTPGTDLGQQLDEASAATGRWYASWGYSRQQYANSDIHIRQPGEGNDFVVHGTRASDYPTGLFHTLRSIVKLNVTAPQENIRIGRFMNDDKSFAIEFSLDHSKYNTRIGQVAHVTGTVGGASYDGPMTLADQTFNYKLHNGLNHLMINGVWFKHLRDAVPAGQAGDLQLVSRLGAGMLLPHAENTVLGHDNSGEIGTKTGSPCCSKHDWWQLNGWTVGTEVGVRYAITPEVYAELTQKFAYGKLHGVPVYHGLASQVIWMSEQVLSVGYVF